jgi:hypothetical protein
MAIITIPSSIGGVSIPGITNVPGGPLGVLFGSKQLSSLQYPRDLGSQTKGHVVQFSINEITPTNFSESKLSQTISDLANVDLKAALGNAVDSVKEAATEAKNIFNKGQGSWNKGESFQISLNKRQKKQVAVISLYMPETVNFQYTPVYNQTSLLNTVTGAVDKVTGLSTGAVASSEITKLGLASQGLAVNDQQQIYFEKIDFRTYDLAFTFTPYSRQESEQIKKIIYMFKYHSLPRIRKGGSGMFFEVPSTFELKFMFNGKENKYVNKVTESVIESIDVNYAPNGWSAHSDGSPTQVTLTLRFKELFLVDKNKMEEGSKNSGAGY